MKTLLIMRHAKSSWANAHQSDHDRPLNDRGRRSAPIMGEKLRREGLTPDLILCSSAARAHQTAELMAEHSGYEKEIQVVEQLYLAGAETYFKTLHEYGGDHERILMIGHNPTIEALIDHYSVRPALITTANLGHIEFDVPTWKDVNRLVHGRLCHLWRPKEVGLEL